MEEDPERWKVDVLRRIEEMQAMHRQQQKRLEAHIESIPVGHSKHFMNLIKLEESNKESETSALSFHIDGILAAETKKIFEAQAERTEERWGALLNYQRDCRERLARQVQNEIAVSNKEAGDGANGGEGAHSRDELQRFPRQQPPLSKEERDFRMKEEAMRAASAENWAENELFNLKNAFDLQFERLEVDWAEYEAVVRAEYDARRASLEARHLRSATGGGFQSPPCRQPSLATTNNTSGSSSRGTDDVGGAGRGGGGTEAPWRDREKQSRLIHTAPVFQPGSGGASSAGATSSRWNIPGGGRGLSAISSTGSTRGRSRDGAAGDYWARPPPEFQRLHETFLALQESAAAQKAAAKKWIRRQRIRMEVQIEAVREERRQRQQRLAAALKEEGDLIAMVRTGNEEVVERPAPLSDDDGNPPLFAETSEPENPMCDTRTRTRAVPSLTN